MEEARSSGIFGTVFMPSVVLIAFYFVACSFYNLSPFQCLPEMRFLVVVKHFNKFIIVVVVVVVVVVIIIIIIIPNYMRNPM
jgi:hypothetical protein